MSADAANPTAPQPPRRAGPTCLAANAAPSDSDSPFILGFSTFGVLLLQKPEAREGRVLFRHLQGPAAPIGPLRVEGDTYTCGVTACLVAACSG